MIQYQRKFLRMWPIVSASVVSVSIGLGILGSPLFAKPTIHEAYVGSDAELRPLVEQYIRHVHDSYSDVLLTTQKMDEAVERFLKNPNQITLDQARESWILARKSYMQTEAFRFYDGPIDGVDPKTQKEGPESRINAWPMDESFIETSIGSEHPGLLERLEIPITVDSVLGMDQVQDESAITTGFHAIEYLLWGPDASKTGPGNRAFSDFSTGDPVRDRRRVYLQLLVKQLHQDLLWLTKAWNTQDQSTYANLLKKQPPREVLEKILTGMIMLSGFEMAMERLAVALDTQDQENEQSCFSDTTWNDFLYNIRGIENIYWGKRAQHAADKQTRNQQNGLSLAFLVQQKSPKLHQDIVNEFDTMYKILESINQPFDQVILGDAHDSHKAKAWEFQKHLLKMAELLQYAGMLWDIKIQNPSENHNEEK